MSAEPPLTGSEIFEIASRAERVASEAATLRPSERRSADDSARDVPLLLAELNSRDALIIRLTGSLARVAELIQMHPDSPRPWGVLFVALHTIHDAIGTPRIPRKAQGA